MLSVKLPQIDMRQLLVAAWHCEYMLLNLSALPLCLLSGHRFSKDVTVQNQGRHPVTLVWSNATFAALKSKQSKGQKSAGKAKMASQIYISLRLLMMLTYDAVICKRSTVIPRYPRA